MPAGYPPFLSDPSAPAVLSAVATLEEPSPEGTLTVDASASPEEIVEEVRRNL